MDHPMTLSVEILQLFHKDFQVVMVYPAPSGDATDYRSGEYFYKLLTDGFVDVKKMVLLK
jgi:hypothetical protein